tara:strand:- start:3204 stop:3380 length:177 start_codon:yes stop_codon:yes gene_type:complete
MMIITHIVVYVLGVVTGGYLASQIEEHINNSTKGQNEKLINNMNKLNNDGTTKNKGKG